jgi:UDP-4-amino-4,6-dideoxy-N-acetyl-beta-L-altrosamine transaminase
MIPYGRQDISPSDIQAVVDVLQSDFLTQGPAVPAFEKSVADHCQVEHALAMNSATSALHVACLSLGVGTGDIVWTSPVTFVASANCALYCGAAVDFVDIDPRTYNLCVQQLEAKLDLAERTGTLPKVIIPVHLCGQPCEMQAIHALGRRYGFRIIEDASHAIGGKYLGEPIGNCRFSDITVFSFHPVKIITTGEGGMALTNDEALANRMSLLRSHGITRNPAQMTRAPDGPWYYQQIDLGFNYRMTDIQAALGHSQMKRLDAFVSSRHAIAARYDRELASLPIVTPRLNPDGYSAQHLYVIRLKLGEIAKSHKMVFEELRAAGIGVNLHYIPVHLQPHYTRLGFQVGYLPEAEKYYREAISIPMYSHLNDADQTYVIQSLQKILLENSNEWSVSRRISNTIHPCELKP